MLVASMQGLHAVERRSGSGTGASRTRKDVADLLHKIDNVEVAMTAAEAMSHVAQNRLEGEIMRSPVLLRSSISPDRADRCGGTRHAAHDMLIAHAHAFA